MIEIGGIDEDDGNSALVGLPVGNDGGRPESDATPGTADAAAAAGGTFHAGA
jgi:hypothetical protein